MILALTALSDVCLFLIKKSPIYVVIFAKELLLDIKLNLTEIKYLFYKHLFWFNVLVS